MSAISPAPLVTVDVHGHYGDYVRGAGGLADWLMSGDAELVASRARASEITWTVVSPLRGLLPRLSADTMAGNEEASQVVPRTPGLLQWVIIDPTRPETYAQADRMLRAPWCVGVKVHPEEHGYPIAEHGDRLFGFCAERGALVLAHSGEDNSLPRDYLRFADRYPDLRLILGHLGNSTDGDPRGQVRAIAEARHGNLWTDTSSAKSMWSRLIEWAVGEIGAERILFGSDCPLYATAAQHARVAKAEISAADRELILGRNAVALLGIEELAPDGTW